MEAKVKSLIQSITQTLDTDIDICVFNPYIAGIGYDELRYFYISPRGEAAFESNNVHDIESDSDDDYKVFAWDELSDYEKQTIHDILLYIHENMENKDFIFGLPKPQILFQHDYIVYKTVDGVNTFYTCCNSAKTAETIARHVDGAHYIHINDIKQEIK